MTDQLLHDTTSSRQNEEVASPCDQSLLVGESASQLWDLTLTQLLQKQVNLNPSRKCVVFPEYDYRVSYEELYQKTLETAKGLKKIGIRNGDRVGILAGNIPAYVELFFAVSHVGGIFVVFNTTYTPMELQFALKHSGCKALFVATSIGKTPTTKIMDMLKSRGGNELPELESIVCLKPIAEGSCLDYDQFQKAGKAISDTELFSTMELQSAGQVCNLQFTSGTTGTPKAAMLTHSNIINNGRFVGDRMRLDSSDTICCPPPLFHCFGLVLGLLAVVTHGGCVVFPSETFQASSVLKAVSEERCTGLHGVPAMFSAQLELLKGDSTVDFSSLRTGIAAGSSVPRKMMADLREKLNMKEITSTYGKLWMTETSPGSFMSYTHDPVEKRLSTVGKILPHTKAKIVNGNGDIVPVGTRGELLVSGFQLQKGYWRNPKQTAEAMQRDADGCLWMRTGDEAVFDNEGYCTITGRIKDIIIRGGENIFPLEIEEILGQHKSIIQSSVVGLPDSKYGEVVAAFLQHRSTEPRPSAEVLRDFVRKTLGWHKAPVHIFWLEEGEDFPKTGSGKVQKHILREHGKKRLKRLACTSRL
ncbi:acetyl-CoA synthetase-like protein [Cadophora sp. DSE1049]|nr:acetyl-CoA synthetase-like protein [Cadophora sp. DSE1049]